MIALCPACHQVKHLGLANVQGRGAQARAHLARVNGWTLARADAYIDEAFGVWAQRGQGPWTLDLEGLRPYVLGSEYTHIVSRLANAPERRTAEQPYVKGVCPIEQAPTSTSRELCDLKR